MAVNPRSTGASAIENLDQGSSYLSDSAEIVAILRVFRDQRAEISLRCDDSDTPIIAKVLDVNDREFLIEDIRPRTAIPLVKPKINFSIAARVHGLYAFIDRVQILSKEEERGLPFFRIALPKNMLVQQRRRSSRYLIPVRVSTRGAQIMVHGETTFVGKILDISAGGLRAQFDGPAPRQHDTIDRCEITIPNLLNLTSRAVIRHARTEGKSATVCGIELTEMPVSDRRRLEQFIQSLAKISTLG